MHSSRFYPPSVTEVAASCNSLKARVEEFKLPQRDEQAALLEAYAQVIKDALIKKHGYDLGAAHTGMAAMHKAYDLLVSKGRLDQKKAKQYIAEDTAALTRLANSMTPERSLG